MAHRGENDRPETLDHEHPEKRIITDHPDMRALKKQTKDISRYAKVLSITGETGTGKELFASLFHYYCNEHKRRTGSIVTFNAGGTDDHHFADTVFGHKKGAFTDATKDREGLVHRAQNGVLFLDEIGDLSLSSQLKLLRLIENGEYFPLGQDRPEMADVFIVLATHKSLIDEVIKGTFRKDLYFRICTHQIEIPPLRDRRSDIPLLAEHFADKFSGESKRALDEDVLAALMDYEFPGNVRELKGMLERALSLTKSLSPKKVVTEWIAKHRILIDSPEDTIADLRTIIRKMYSLPMLQEFKKQISELLIDEALYRSGGSQTGAARLIGITQAAISKWLKKRSAHR